MYNTNNKKSIIIAIVLGIIILLIAITMFFVFSNKSAQKLVDQMIAEDQLFSDSEKWAEGVINYNGKQYKFNNRLKTFLLMGIDKDGVVTEAENFQAGGQSDAMFLLVTNPDTMELKVVCINRNTMTPVQMFAKDGTNLGTADAQICVQHGFGDGKKYSCNLAVEAVEKLFYNVPIDGYLAINVGGVPMLNDFIGGVELEVLEGLDYLGDDQLKTGNKLTLNGEQAYKYLRFRSTEEFGSADKRLARQQQYINLYLPKFREKINSGAGSAISLYNEVYEYVETNIDVATIMNEIAQYEFDPNEMYTIPGETILADTGYEEYHVEKEGFYDLIINVFYDEYVEE